MDISCCPYPAHTAPLQNSSMVKQDGKILLHLGDNSHGVSSYQPWDQASPVSWAQIQLEIFHCTKGSWRCIWGQSHLRQQVNFRNRGKSFLQSPHIHIFPPVSGTLSSFSLPSLPKPALSAANICRGDHSSAGCHAAVWLSFVLSWKQQLSRRVGVETSPFEYVMTQENSAIFCQMLHYYIFAMH